MQIQIINDIDNYIAFLKAKGLSVSVHGKLVSGLIRHNIHRNTYCSYIKTHNDAWNHCVKCQQKVFDAYNGDVLFGMCWAGVEEYVFYVDSKTFVSVSGYGIDKEKATRRIHRLSQTFHFDEQELTNVYDLQLKHEEEHIEELKTLIKPLCHMLSLLQIVRGDVMQTESQNKTFDAVLSYVERNYMQDITVREIAYACACSESTVAHLFKSHTDQSVKKYINLLRLKQAEKLLLSSDLPVGNVATLCGFSNSNYFSTAFKKQFHVSPQTYRQQNGKKRA